MKSKYLMLFLMLIIGSRLNAQPRYTANWEPIVSSDVPAWLTDAKIGIFLNRFFTTYLTLTR
ncbi:MAG TPA: hypothetical protein VGB63_18290 [Pedobacter sp.]